MRLDPLGYDHALSRLERGAATAWNREQDRATGAAGVHPVARQHGPWPVMRPDTSQRVTKLTAQSDCRLDHTTRRCWYCGAEPTTETNR